MPRLEQNKEIDFCVYSRALSVRKILRDVLN